MPTSICPVPFKSSREWLRNLPQSLVLLVKDKMKFESLKFTQPAYSRLVLGKTISELSYVLEKKLCLTNVFLHYAAAIFDFKGILVFMGLGFSQRNLVNLETPVLSTKLKICVGRRGGFLVLKLLRAFGEKV